MVEWLSRLEETKDSRRIIVVRGLIHVQYSEILPCSQNVIARSPTDDEAISWPKDCFPPDWIGGRKDGMVMITT